MWRILLVACLWLLDCPDSPAQDLLITRYTFTGNTTQPQFVHEAVVARPMSLAPAIPVNCPTCPFVTGNPSLGPGYGSYGWSDQANSPDLTQYFEIPLKVEPGRALELVRMSFEIHRQSQAAQKWQLRYSKNNFASAVSSGIIAGTNSWSTVTIPLTSLQLLQELSDSVTFRLYPFDAKKGPSEDKNTIVRLDSVRIYNAGEPLPVELTHFTTLPEGLDIRLNWATATEINSEYFGIEHALEGTAFQELDRVPAAGWSVALQSYQWMHRAAGPGQHYYRLRIVDRDGQWEYSPIVATRMDGHALTPQARFTGRGTLMVTGCSNTETLNVWDQTGRMILNIPSGPESSLQEFPADHWNPGVYIVQSGTTILKVVRP